MKCRICENECASTLTDELRKGHGTVHYCENCHYGMLKPSFSSAQEYYEKEYRKRNKDVLSMEERETPQMIFDMRKNYQGDRLNVISQYYDTNKSFLEIGSSAGQFLWYIAKQFSEIVGIEFDVACAEFSQKLIERETAIRPRIYTRGIESIDWRETDVFDYIGFFQVLEHIEDPVYFLENVRERLKPDGRVFIEVPNLDDPLRVLWDVPAYEKFYYHEAHLSYFSEKSLSLLLAKCGFEIENIYFLQDYNLLNNLYWYFNNAPQDTCEFGLDKPHINFKSTAGGVGDQINQLLLEMNARYFKILADNKMTSNMLAVAKRAD